LAASGRDVILLLPMIATLGVSAVNMGTDFARFRFRIRSHFGNRWSCRIKLQRKLPIAFWTRRPTARPKD